MKTIYQLVLVFWFATNACFSQNNHKFATKQEYLNYLEKEYKIQPNEVYLFDAIDQQAYLGKYASIVFLNGTKITSIDEIRAVDGNICSPKKFMSNLTSSRIEKAYTVDPQLATVFFRNLADDSVLETTKQTIALFFFSYQLGALSLQYYKHKRALENLNIKCILLCLDSANIAELDINQQTPIIIKKIN